MIRWPTALLLAALCMAGCRRAQPTFDPFLPRTRIPPPPTGAATGAPDAYYTNPTPPMTGSAPGWPAPATGAPVGNQFAPPASYPYPQPTTAPGSSTYTPAPGPAPLPTTGATPPVGQIPRANRMKYVATADTSPSAVYERGKQADASQNQPELAANEASSAVDIMDLPPVTRVARSE